MGGNYLFFSREEFPEGWEGAEILTSTQYWLDPVPTKVDTSFQSILKQFR